MYVFLLIYRIRFKFLLSVDSDRSPKQDSGGHVSVSSNEWSTHAVRRICPLPQMFPTLFYRPTSAFLYRIYRGTRRSKETCFLLVNVYLQWLAYKDGKLWLKILEQSSEKKNKFIYSKLKRTDIFGINFKISKKRRGDNRTFSSSPHRSS